MSVRAWESNPAAHPWEARMDPVGGRAATPVGEFRYDCTTDTWWWSDELFAIHALTPGETLLTSKLIRAFKHPEAVEAVDAAFRATVQGGAPFARRHRIITARGHIRQVITVGAAVHGGDRVVAVRGFVLDVTDSVKAAVEEEAWKGASGIITQRAAIERAKGALMAVHGVGEDEAFALLRGLSNRQNVKLRDVAVELLEAMRSTGVGRDRLESDRVETVRYVNGSRGVINPQTAQSGPHRRGAERGVSAAG